MSMRLKSSLEEVQYLGTQINKSLAMKIRDYCIKNNITLRAVLEEALTEFLQKKFGEVREAAPNTPPEGPLGLMLESQEEGGPP